MCKLQNANVCILLFLYLGDRLLCDDPQIVGSSQLNLIAEIFLCMHASDEAAGKQTGCFDVGGPMETSNLAIIAKLISTAHDLTASLRYGFR